MLFFMQKTTTKRSGNFHKQNGTASGARGRGRKKCTLAQQYSSVEAQHRMEWGSVADSFVHLAVQCELGLLSVGVSNEGQRKLLHLRESLYTSHFSLLGHPGTQKEVATDRQRMTPKRSRVTTWPRLDFSSTERYVSLHIGWTAALVMFHACLNLLFCTMASEELWKQKKQSPNIIMALIAWYHVVYDCIF